MKKILLYTGLFLSMSIFGMEHFSVETLDDNHFIEDLQAQGNEGLLIGTLVKVPFGYTAIEDLGIGDMVISCNKHNILETDFVVGIERKKVKEVVQFIVGGHPIIVAHDHKFFTPQLKRWIKAHQIAYGDLLMSFPHINTQIEAIEIIKGEFEVVSISVENNHNFFVSEKDILVHNMLVLAPGGLILSTGAAFLETALPIAITIMGPVICGPAIIVGGTLIGGTLIANHLKNIKDSIIESDNDEDSGVTAPSYQEQNLEFIPLFMNFLDYEIEIDEEYHYPYLYNQAVFINADYFYETHKCNLEYWTIEMYEQQWREGLERLKTHNSSCLVTSIPNPQRKYSKVNTWILYKIGPDVHIQNHFIRYETYGNKTITPENCYDFFIKPRKVFSESGMKISEWVVPIVKIPLEGIAALGPLMPVLAMQNPETLKMVITNTLRIQHLSPTFISI